MDENPDLILSINSYPSRQGKSKYKVRGLRKHLGSTNNALPCTNKQVSTAFNTHPFDYTSNLELGESLGLGLGRSNLHNVESHSLGDWSTLTNSNNVTLLDSESWRNVSSEVLVSLLVSVVFWNVVQVVSSDDDGSVHFGGHNSSGQDSTSDRDGTGEWTLLVNVSTLDGGLRSLESQSDVLVPSLGSSRGLSLWVGEDVWLLNVRTLN
ncbi:hypothetical protein OGAPHI_006022 [Ogataea philodendri]|uniref:Uncharacterized protein n=1 Tax=Ogataea philodendri TaxID=1378263 RepID=A0A9P8NZD4_9ASCO|nr:uncharacterized protein OGAPHI_006022 [Ogataea philodendri]KAH3661844.1 hypothetical protein OGAPHI_006022 [Ogataea philodendri]